jgi:hypothetical protein
MLGTYTIEVYRYNPVIKKYNKISKLRYNIRQRITIPSYSTLLNNAIDSFRPVLEQNLHRLPQYTSRRKRYIMSYKEFKKIEERIIQAPEVPVMDGLKKYDVVRKQFIRNTPFETYIYEGCGVLTKVLNVDSIEELNEDFYLDSISCKNYTSQLKSYTALREEIHNMFKTKMDELAQRIPNNSQKSLLKVHELFVHPAFADAMSREQLIQLWKDNNLPERTKHLLSICEELGIKLYVSDNTKLFPGNVLYLFREENGQVL